MGHILDYTYGIRDTTEFRVIWGRARTMLTEGIKKKDILSQYAFSKMDGSEFIAEAWSEFINSDAPREFAKKVGELILTKAGKL